MKRPNTVPSSSSYRENNNSNVSENLHSKSIGCMSGIFQFVYKYQSRRKSLTFGKKKTMEKNIVISSSTKSPSPSPKTEQRCDRSPAIPQEIRRSNSVNSPANFRPSTPSQPHSVVARLMRLTSVPAAPDSNADKKRKLLGALEKCDQDLKDLKKIIDAVQSTDLAPLRSDPTAEIEPKTKTAVSENELPSPVSVLDKLARSPSLSQTRCARRQSNGKDFNGIYNLLDHGSFWTWSGLDDTAIDSSGLVSWSRTASLQPAQRNSGSLSRIPLRCLNEYIFQSI